MPLRRSALSEYFCILKAAVARFRFLSPLITSVFWFHYLLTISSGPFHHHRRYISALKHKNESKWV